VAFPAISTGVYGYPKDDAAAVAVHAVAGFLRGSNFPQNVIFCCFDEPAAALHREVISSLDPA
jgi:O-acetyl-ADP-ribose deacetylase (regulator of RNase III)